MAQRERILLQLRRRRVDPWVGEILGEGDGNSLQYSCLGNPMDRGAWRAIDRGVAKSRIWLSAELVPKANKWLEWHSGWVGSWDTRRDILTEFNGNSYLYIWESSKASHSPYKIGCIEVTVHRPRNLANTINVHAMLDHLSHLLSHLVFIPSLR